MPRHDTAQIVKGQVRGVDDKIRAVPQIVHQDPFAFDAVGDAPLQLFTSHPTLLIRHRMAPAGFRVALAKNLVVAIEKHHLRIEIGVPHKAVNLLNQQPDVKIAGSNVHADRHWPDRLHQI